MEKREKVINECVSTIKRNFPGSMTIALSKHLESIIRTEVTKVYDAALWEGFRTTV